MSYETQIKNLSAPLDRETIRKEILRCSKDPVYFVSHYIKIAHPIKGMIPFDLFPYQEQLLRDYCEYRYNLILKARQLGITTTTAAFIAWMMLFQQSKTILNVATKEAVSIVMVDMVKSMISYLPKWMILAEVDLANVKTLSFRKPNGSKLTAAATSKDVARSNALSLLVVDEAAHVDKLEELWESMEPAISAGGKCIILSTPNGADGLFYKLCQDAQEGLNDFHLTTLSWDVHPERDVKWFKDMTRTLTKRQVAQEYQCSFNMSGETVIDPEDIEYFKTETTDPIRKEELDRALWIWKDPEPGKVYLVSADVSNGAAEDYSAFHVFDAENMEQQAEYKGKLPTDQFGQLLVRIAGRYNGALLVVERNTYGQATINEIKRLGYANLYYERKGPEHEYIDQYIAENRPDCDAGIYTSSDRRPLLVDKMSEFVRKKLFSLRSMRMVSEFYTFIWMNGKPQGKRGGNDDLVLALALACWVKENALLSNMSSVAYTKALLTGVRVQHDTLDTKIKGMLGWHPDTKKEVVERITKEEKMAEAIERFKAYGGWIKKG